MTNINFPRPGMGINEGTVARWLRAVGERVHQGEILVEVETAKAIQEIEAPVSGVLRTILVSAGEDVAVNASLGQIEESA